MTIFGGWRLTVNFEHFSYLFLVFFCSEGKYLFNDFAFVSKVIIDLVIVIDLDKHFVFLKFAITS